MAVKLEELTNGTTVVKEVNGLNTFTWQGTAVFDVLVHMVNENLKIQYDEGRIKATDYAEAYIAGLQTCITEAMQFIMQKDIINEEARLKAAQADAFPLESAKDLKVKQAQINVALEEARLKAAQAEAYSLQSAKDLEVKQAQIDVALEEKNLKAAQAKAYPLESAKDLEVKQAQIDVALEEKNLKAAQADAYSLQSSKDLEVKQANIDLLSRQKEGFDDNKYQKLFEAQMNAWALMFSSGLLTTQPSIISNDSASALYNTLKPK